MNVLLTLNLTLSRLHITIEYEYILIQFNKNNL